MLLPAASAGETLRGFLLYQLGAEPLAVSSSKSFLGAHSSQALALLDEQLLMDLICAFGAAQQHKC